MRTQLKQWFSLALCCGPMLAAPLLLSLAGVLGWRTRVFGEVLTALAVLACPVSMGLMMWRMSRHSNTCATPTPTMTAETPAQPEGEVPQLKAAQTK